MRSYPEDADDQKRLELLNAAPWMIDALKCNPSYVYWGPHEDYMMAPGRDESTETNPYKKDSGWASRVLLADWKSFEQWSLDDLNECVHFYFEINRASEECATCGNSGYHPDAQWVERSWYEHSSPFANESSESRSIETMLKSFSNTAPSAEPLRRAGVPSAAMLHRYGKPFSDFCKEMLKYRYWSNRLTQDEVDELVKRGRLHELTRDGKHPTAAEVNDWSASGGLRHDSINRWICVEQRLKRFGIPKKCPDCDGHGYVFTEPDAHLSLVLWWLHPRKGCSRGIEIKRLSQENFESAKAFLRKAAERNAERFKGIMA